MHLSLCLKTTIEKQQRICTLWNLAWCEILPYANPVLVRQQLGLGEPGVTQVLFSSSVLLLVLGRLLTPILIYQWELGFSSIEYWKSIKFWRRKRQPTPVFLPGESHGQRSLTDYSPWGHKESDTTKLLDHNILSYAALLI